MDEQRILVVTIKQDVTTASDAQIEAVKALWQTSLDRSPGLKVSFEIREIDPMARVRSMLRLVRSEYEIGSEEAAEPVEVAADKDRCENLIDEF